MTAKEISVFNRAQSPESESEIAGSQTLPSPFAITPRRPASWYLFIGSSAQGTIITIISDSHLYSRHNATCFANTTSS